MWLEQDRRSLTVERELYESGEGKVQQLYVKVENLEGIKKKASRSLKTKMFLLHERDHR